jgi:UDP-glucose 4-epimerase
MQINLVSLRYSIILGGGQSLQSTESGLLRNFYHLWIAGGAPLVYGNGQQERDFIHIEDVTRANLLALSEETTIEIYNVAGFKATAHEVALHFHEVTGCAPPVILNKDVRPGGEYTLTSSGRKIEDSWRFSPELGIRQQVEDFISFNKRSQN